MMVFGIGFEELVTNVLYVEVVFATLWVAACKFTGDKQPLKSFFGIQLKTLKVIGTAIKVISKGLAKLVKPLFAKLIPTVYKSVINGVKKRKYAKTA